MNVFRISADRVSYLEEYGVLTVAFVDAAHAGTEPPYLLLSRTLSPSAQDARLGHDLPFIELSDQGKSLYGGISSVDLSLHALRVVLDPRGASQLGVCEIEVVFTDALAHGGLKQALRRVFGE